MSSDKVYAYLYIPKHLAEWLKNKAQEEHRSFNNYVSLVLEEHYLKEKRSEN